MESVKDWLYAVGFFLAAGTAWGDGLRRHKNQKERQDRLEQELHEIKHWMGNAGYITGPQHDKLQSDCQRLLLSKIEGLSNLMSSRMDNLGRRLDDLHRDVKNGR